MAIARRRALTVPGGAQASSALRSAATDTMSFRPHRANHTATSLAALRFA